MTTESRRGGIPVLCQRPVESINIMRVPAALASRSKTVWGVATVPIFLVAPQVKLPKRFDLAQDAIAAQHALSGKIVTNWVEGQLG